MSATSAANLLLLLDFITLIIFVESTIYEAPVSSPVHAVLK
jgi:hypothetical protein